MTRWHHTWICRFWIKQNSLFFGMGKQNSLPFATVQPEQLNCRGTEGKRSRIAAEPTQAALQAASGYWPAVRNWNGTESGPSSEFTETVSATFFFLAHLTGLFWALGASVEDHVFVSVMLDAGQNLTLRALSDNCWSCWKFQSLWMIKLK